jgi:hypothetical protein
VERIALDLAVIQELPMIWHETTPQKFGCQAGCVCCCVTTLFFPSEVKGLPAEVRAHLTLRQGLIRPVRRPPGVCVFFDEQTSWHCAILEQRPLRCRLYPYLPIITEDAVVILADPLCTVSWPETHYPEWFRCYGLGCGTDITVSVEALSREFLRKMVDEYPQLVEGYLRVNDVDECINWQEVEKYHHPTYPVWDTEAIRQATRL